MNKIKIKLLMKSGREHLVYIDLKEDEAGSLDNLIYNHIFDNMQKEALNIKHFEVADNIVDSEFNYIGIIRDEIESLQYHGNIISK